MSTTSIDVPLDVKPESLAGSDRERRGSAGRTALRIGVTLVILVLLFWQVRWSEVWHALESVKLSYLLVVCILWIPTQLFQYLRWWYLARQAGAEVSATDIRRGYWVGYTLGLITPGRIGTYGRALALRNCSVARAAGLTVIERNYSAFVLNGLGLIALVILPVLGWKSPLPIPEGYVGPVLVGAGVLLLALGFYPRAIAGPLRRIVHKLPLGEKLGRALHAVEEITPGQGALLMLLAVLSLSSALLQFVVLVYSMGVEIPVFSGMLAVLLNFFLKGNLPISIGNLGVGEWTAMICLAGLGVAAPVAVAASLLLFFINVFIPGLLGLPYVSSLRMPPSLRRGSSS